MKKNMQISPNGFSLVEEFEGLSLVPYICPASKKSIGYGHVIRDGESFTQITKEQAETLLRIDMKWVEKTLNNTISADLTQNEIDALASLIYNIGGTAFRNSTLLKLLNQDNFADAADEFLKWCHIGKEISQGLLNRREAEKALFEKDEA